MPVAAALLAYRHATQCGFIGLDDDLYVLENPIVSLGLTVEGMRWAFTALHASTWQPLVWLSYMLEVSLSGGVTPAVFHRTNLLLHVAGTLLLFACWTKLTARPRLGALIALLFAIHPVHVESVVWIAQRKDVLSHLFWWGAVLAYIGYARGPSPRRYAGVLAMLVAGLMAKPMLLTLPAALLLLDFWPLRRLRLDQPASWKKPILEKLPLLVPVAASLILTVYVQHQGGSLLDTATISLWGRVGNAAVSLWRYVGNLLWPFRLAVLYPHPGTWPLFSVLAAMAATLAALGLGWHERERRPWLLFGMLWFSGTLVPVLGLIQFGWHAMADRFLYIPAIGLYVIVAFALAGLWQHRPAWRQGMLAAMAVLALALGARTRNQVSLWKDSLTLFSHAVEVTHNNWMMHNGVGAALSRRGRNDEAAPHFETVIRLKPGRPKAWFNLGHVRFMQGRWAEAVACFEQSIAIFPTKQARFNLAVAHTRNQNPQAAEAAYHELLDRHPGHIPAMLNLAAICRADGRLQRAITICRQALALAPGEPETQTALGMTLIEAGEQVEALKLFVAVLKADPDHPEARRGVQLAMQPAR